jgi:RNA polymerase primary sigma factor
MKEKDVFRAIAGIGKKRGTLTYDEIYDAFPSAYYSLDELEGLLKRLEQMGVRVVDFRGRAN